MVFSSCYERAVGYDNDIANSVWASLKFGSPGPYKAEKTRENPVGQAPYCLAFHFKAWEVPGGVSQVDCRSSRGISGKKGGDRSPVDVVHLPAGYPSRNPGWNTENEREDGDWGESKGVGLQWGQSAQVHTLGVQAKAGFLQGFSYCSVSESRV